MAFKFPFTNYHELNLTWVLEQLKKLFEESNENVETIESYEDRLSAVETELPVVEATANQAETTANAAATLAQTAKSTADTANENALAASAQAGLARQEAAAAEAEAQAATQAAQQAQATVQNFDGRITQAENDASEALQEAQSFENRVDAAINTANNAANTATIAQGIAVNANQNAATALDTAQTADGKAEAAQDAADIADGKAEAAQQAAEQAAQDVIDKAPVIINTASGDIASFHDGADSMPIKSLVASIEPVQDLHGQDAPYPAGGGNNLVPNVYLHDSGYSRLGVTYTYGDDGIVYLSGTATSGYEATFSKISNLPSGTYIASGEINSTGVAIYLRKNDTFVGSIKGSPVSFTVESGDEVSFGFVITNGTAFSNVPAKFILNSGSTALPWSPYSNICPISGHTGMTVMRTGVNYPSTDTAYHAYTGTTIPITWQSEAGTVYGGTLDVISGKLIATHKMYELDGTETGWTKYSTQTVYNSSLLGDVLSAGQAVNGLCSHIESVNGVIDYNYLVHLNAGSGAEFRKLIDYWGLPDNEVTTWTAYLAQQKTNGTPVQILGLLKTPIEYTLTANELTTLYGQNNVWTDVGSIQSCKYPADTKLYIDGKVAELQALILEN